MKKMNLRRYFPDPFKFCLVRSRLVIADPPVYRRQFFACRHSGLAHPIGCQQDSNGHDARQKPLKLIAFFGVLVGDIIVSNIVVAKQVLGVPERLQPGFVAIPMDLKEALPITILASTISLTPGTVSIEITEDRKTLYVHALHVESETELVGRIKHRYEKPLKEIFEC
jgi:multicomponent K+:H+ antiporter subunit E